jgi:hypothetical protein
MQVTTVACKLEVLPELAREIDATLKAFAAACTWINANTPPKLTNRTAMQQLVYAQVREQFGLSSNLAIQAVRRVCANRKTAKDKGKEIKDFAPTSAGYDARIFSFCEKNWTVSLKLLSCRQNKACLKGVKIVFVNPAYTSRTCAKCLYIYPDPSRSYRSGKRFS